MRFYFSSLGCDKTLSDSEHIIASLIDSGMSLTESMEEADLVIINTCCFIGDALEESINAVIEAGEYTKGSDKKLIVCGCMAKRFEADIHNELPEANLIIPETESDIISKRLLAYAGKEEKTGKNLRFLTGPGFYAYLKIAEGCNKHCSYCVIPSIRGSYRSIPSDVLVKETEELAKRGVKELILVAQETTLYGIDIYGRKCLHELIEKLSLIEGIKWIRLLYAYPEEIYDELISVMSANPKVCHYIDMPIQHVNNDILQKMGRRTTKKSIKDKIFALRQAMPDIAIRTTFICGFPGESSSDFKEMSDFINEICFDRLGAFSFSPEEGTKAFDMQNQISSDMADFRRDAIMQAQGEISLNKNKSFIGQVLKCIVEGYLFESGVYQARSYRDAPDVDGLVFFESDRELISGDFVFVKITDVSQYDLMGEIYEYSE